MTAKNKVSVSKKVKKVSSGKKLKKRVTVHKSLLKLAPVEKTTLNFKVVESEAKEIRAKAKRYTRGNVTALARLAIAHFRPKKSELVSIRATTR